MLVAERREKLRHSDGVEMTAVGRQYGFSDSQNGNLEIYKFAPGCRAQ